MPRSTTIMFIDLLLACYLANTTCAITNIMTTLIFIIVSRLHAFFLVVVVRSSLQVLVDTLMHVHPRDLAPILLESLHLLFRHLLFLLPLHLNLGENFRQSGEDFRLFRMSKRKCLFIFKGFRMRKKFNLILNIATYAFN